MFFAYEYFVHPFGQLHASVGRFLWRLRRSNRKQNSGTLPAAFRVADWCDGMLKDRAEKVACLKKLLRAFYHDYRKLDRSAQKHLYNAFRVMNRIEEQLSGELPHCDIESLPPLIRDSTKALFLYLYTETLSSADVRRQHYRCFCRRLKRLRTHECPFCGLEDLLEEKHRLQDYDHLLGKARYPLAAINPQNLAPMGSHCNQVFKGKKLLLFDDLGNQRRAFYPYREHGKVLEVDLSGSQRPKVSRGTGSWQARLLPNCPEVRTWEDVFELPERMIAYRISDRYDGWVDQFVQSVYRSPPDGAWTADGVKREIGRYAEIFAGDLRIENRVIRSAIFRFLANQPDAKFYQNLAARLETRRTHARSP